MERIFIVPYRDKIKEMKELNEYLEKLFKLKNWNSENTDVIFSHQNDKRMFNRGAVKNIAFLYAKETYDNYKDIDFIFNDIDIFPNGNIEIPYKTEKGVVSHYYGFLNTLGGIFVIKGVDFEKSKGFPNFWAWGWEDNEILKRCLNNNINIDRSIFYPFCHKEIHLNKNNSPLYSPEELTLFMNNKSDNFYDLEDINYIRNGDMLDIKTFKTKYPIPKYTKIYTGCIKKTLGRSWNLF